MNLTSFLQTLYATNADQKTAAQKAASVTKYRGIRSGAYLPKSLKKKVDRIARESNRSYADIIKYCIHRVLYSGMYEYFTNRLPIKDGEIYLVTMRLPASTLLFIRDIAWDKKIGRYGNSKIFIGLCVDRIMRFKSTFDWIQFFKNGNDITVRVLEELKYHQKNAKI